MYSLTSKKLLFFHVRYSYLNSCGMINHRIRWKIISKKKNQFSENTQFVRFVVHILAKIKF